MATRTDTERKRGRMRAAASMNSLARKIGVANPHQFALHFDTYRDEYPVIGKWRSSFNGEKAYRHSNCSCCRASTQKCLNATKWDRHSLWQAMMGAAARPQVDRLD